MTCDRGSNVKKKLNVTHVERAGSGCDKIPAHKMKIISIGFVPASEVPQPRRHAPWNNWFFEHEEGVIDQDGEIMCPICGCCSLKQVSFSENHQWVHKNETTSRLLGSCAGTHGRARFTAGIAGNARIKKFRLVRIAVEP